MLVVNLYGSPGSGKSTGAAYVFSKLKLLGVNVELVTEFAKDKVWEESKETFKNQAYIFGEQYFRVSRLENKVDVVVTDSPLLLSAFYNNDKTLGDTFNKMVSNVANHYDSLNFYVERIKPYNKTGRIHTVEESDLMNLKLKTFVKENCNKNLIYGKGKIEFYDIIWKEVFSKLKGGSE